LYQKPCVYGAFSFLWGLLATLPLKKILKTLFVSFLLSELTLPKKVISNLLFALKRFVYRRFALLSPLLSPLFSHWRLVGVESKHSV